MKKKIALLGAIFIFGTGVFFAKRIFVSGVKQPFQEYLELAQLLKEQGEFQKAIQYCKKALDFVPDNFDVNLEMGMICFKLKDYEAALKSFEKASTIMPNLFSLQCAIARTYNILGKFPEAIEAYKKAIALNPKDGDAHRNLSFIYRLRGDFQKGWKEREIAETLWIEFGEESYMPQKWDGSDLAGKTLLIRDRGANGDMFNWIRYAYLVKQQGVTVVVETRPYRVLFISLLPYIDQVIPRGEKIPPCDCQIYLGSMNRIMNTTVETIPAPIPYLYADKTLVETWGKELAKDKKFKIGICWEPATYKNKKTGKTVKNSRAMPLIDFYPLSTFENVSLYSLQMINGVEQLNDIPQDFEITVFGEDFDKKHGSFMDTAAVLKHLDLVITVDTSIGHLAGALDVPVWVMLPSVPDWRWLLGRSDTPWYPSMRLFRQPKMGNWNSVMQEVVAELTKVLEKKS